MRTIIVRWRRITRKCANATKRLLSLSLSLSLSKTRRIGSTASRVSLFAALFLAAFVFAGGLILQTTFAAITTVTVTSPNGGEKWTGTQNITWTSDDSGSGTVNLYYCPTGDCGVTSRQIVAGTPNDGTYAWDTSTVLDGDLATYKIKIASATDTNINDTSDADFEIKNTAATTYGVVGTTISGAGDTVVLTFTNAMATDVLTTGAVTGGITSITGSTSGALTLTNATGAWSGGNTIYTVTLDQATDHANLKTGETVIVVLKTTVLDGSGYSITTAGVTSAAVTGDTTAPTFTAARTALNTIVLTFDEKIDASIDTDAWTVEGADATVNSTAVTDGTSMTLTTTGLTATDGTPTVTYVAANGDATDLAGNEVADSANAAATDQVKPTFVSAAATSDTNIQLTFSEAVTVTTANGSDFTITGVTITGAAVNGGDATKVDLTVDSLGNTAFTSTDLHIAADAVKDTSSATNGILETSSQTVTDGQAPTLTSAKVTGPNEITVVYSESVTSVIADYTNLGGGLAGRTVTEVAGSPGTTHILTIDGAVLGIDATGTMDIGVGVVDASTNTLTALVGQTVTDGQAPTFVSASATSDTNIRIVMSETMAGGTVTFGAADQWTATGITASAATINGANIDLTVNSLGDTGFTAADFAFGAGGGSLIQDAAGNAASAFSAKTIADGQAPTITSVKTGDASGVGLDKVTVTFSENVNATTTDGTGWTVTGTDKGDLTVTGNTDPAGTNTMVLTLSGPFASENPDATITYTTGGGNLVDAATTPNELATGASPNISDGIKPTFVSAEATSDTNIQLTFSEAVTVTTADGSDFTITGVTITGAVSNADTTKVDLTVNSLGNTAFTANTLSIVADAVKDTSPATNGILAISSQTVTDGQAPTFVSASATSDTNIRIVMSETMAGGTVTFGAADQWTATGITASAATINGANIDLTVNSLGDTGFTAADFAFGAGGGSLIQDAAGNAASAFSAKTIADGQAPILTITLSDYTLAIGDTPTVTFTFSEAPSGFDATDVTIGSGTIGVVSATGDPLVFEATLTSATSTEEATNVITADTNWTDAAGNAPAASSSSANYEVDTIRPTVTIGMSDYALKIDDTATITATFSEVPSGFTVANITAPNGDLSGFAVDGGNPLVYTVTFTPTAGTTDLENVVTIDTSWTDAAGNAPDASTDSSNYAIDLVAPTVTLTHSHGDLYVRDADTDTITATFVDAGGLTSTPTITIGSLVTAAGMTETSPLVWTYVWNVPAGNDGAQAISVSVADTVGNANDAATGVTSETIDNTAPTVDAGANAGEKTATFTHTDATASDTGSGIATYAWTASGLGTVTFSNADVLNPGNISADTYDNYTATLTVTDVAGNSNSDTFTFSYLPETGLVATSWNPANGETGVAIADGTATATFNSNITLLDAAKVTIKKDSDETSVADGAVSVDGENGTILDIPYIGLEAGTTYRINITQNAVRDGNGRTNAAAVSYFTTAMVGTPVVAITAPTAGNTVSGDIDVTFTTNDGGSTAAQVSLDGGAWDNATSPYQIPTTDLTNGSHTLRVRDTVNGVTGYSDYITFMVNNHDTSVPEVSSVFPTQGLVVSVNSGFYVDFSEPMDSTTISSATVKLCLVSDVDCAYPITPFVMLAEGGTRALIGEPMLYGQEYWILVTTGVKDQAGNALAENYGSATTSNFSTEEEPTVALAVTQVDSTKTYATADGTYENGWQWVFHVTVPTSETSLTMKFGDLINADGVHSVGAENIHFYSAQASGANSTSTAITLTDADTDSDVMTLDGDAEDSIAGRQILVTVEVAVPEGSTAGSYSTSYNITTN